MADYETDDHESEADARLTEEIIEVVCDRSSARQAKEITREIIAPLIQRAEVSKRLKDRALSPGPKGIHADDLEYDRADITNAMARMIEDGAVTLNARGAYEVVDVADPDTDEAIKLARRILDGWPDAEVEKILSVLRG